MGQRESILYDGLDRVVLDSERPLPLGRVNKSRLLGPAQFMMLSFMDGEFVILVVIINVGVGVVGSEGTGLRLIPDRSLTSV